MSRALYLIAYDVCDHRRLALVHDFLKGYSSGGQKSVYECYLTPSDVAYVERELRALIADGEDRVYILGLDGRSRTHTLGIAVQPKDPTYFYFG
jgi:CRISPR-associated protein Cas2